MPASAALDGADTRQFYAELSPLATFEQAANLTYHSDLPSDWWVVVTDVVNSTKAIQAGKYKDVNTVGASTIIAVINTDRSIELPFVFGGDGASLAIPPVLERQVRSALLGAKDLARTAFGLELRTGMVRVGELQAEEAWVKVAKYTKSQHVMLAAFSGHGWATAEGLIKNPATRARYEVVATAEIKAEASFEGFECRWQGIKSRQDHKLCILVSSMAQDPNIHAQRYLAILGEVGAIYGDVPQMHPVQLDHMKLSLSPRRLSGEARVRTAGFGLWQRLKYLGKSLLMNLAGMYLFASGKDTETVVWSAYRDDLLQNADFRKFDGSLKMVVDSTIAQTRSIHAYLEGLFQKGEVIYGLSQSKEALMTCLIFSYNGKHAHFIDGADGGYALAAVDLKARLKRLRSDAGVQ